MAYSEYGFDLRAKTYGELHITVPAATIIAVPGTYVKMVGTTLADSVNEFAMSGDNRLICGNLTTTNYYLNLSVALQTTINNQTLACRIYKNGVAETSSTMTTRAETANTPCMISINQIINLAKDDYIEVWITNITAPNNITAINATLSVVEI